VRDALKLAPSAGVPAADSIDAELDTIGVDVAGLDGDAMRGTDGAELAGAAATAVATLNDFDPALDVVAHVTLVDTTTANTDMRGTDGAYTGTPPTASSIAQAVWEYGTRTLTSFGTLVATIWANVSRTLTDKAGFSLTSAYDAAKNAAAPGAEMDLVDAPNPTAITAIQNGLALEATLDAICGVGWTDETLVALMAAVQALGPGLGDNTVTLTLNDGDGNPASNVLCVVRNVAGSTVYGIDTTDGGGEVEFQLDDGTYSVRYGPASLYTFSNPYALTVAGDTEETFECVALAAPSVPSTDNIIIYSFERKVEADAAFGASDVTVKILSVEGRFRTDDETDAQRSVVGTEYTTDATGLWSFEVARALDGARIVLQKSYAAASGTTVTERWTATIDVDAANEAGQVSWADLRPRQG
jgi:hypothetical protein